jgi:hypothetical protein
MKQRRLFYPLMLAVYPILFLFSHNIGELSARVIVGPLLASLLITLTLWAMLTKIFQSVEKSALLTSLLLFLFFSYGHFEKFLSHLNVVIVGIWLGPTKILSVLWLVLSIAAVYGLSKSKKEFRSLSRFLNFITTCLVLLTLFNIGLFYFKQYRSDSSGPMPATESGKPALASAQDPDIYYIILDEYLRDDMLKEIYHFDNSPFIAELERRGFYVAKASRSNYVVTVLSISSSLNMRYINEEAYKLAAAGTSNRIPMARLFEENFLARYLRSRGYQFVAMNSGYWWTRIESADVFISGGNDEFFNQLVNTSILSLEQDINKRLWGKSLYDIYMTHMQRRRILNVFEHLQNMPPSASPRLVFAHLVSPHPPFIFGPKGQVVLFNAKLGLFTDNAAGLIGPDGMTHDVFKQRFTDQVQYLNEMLLQTVDVIRRQSQRPAIIILQGDHGPRSLSDLEKSDNPARRLLMLKERMCILNAYYLPGGGQEILYPTITPVNTFRLILNRYFGQNYERLSDRNYFSSGDGARYFHLYDVTDEALSAQSNPDGTAEKNK